MATLKIVINAACDSRTAFCSCCFNNLKNRKIKFFIFVYLRARSAEEKDGKQTNK